MAIVTTDHRAALEFINQAKIKECYVPSREAPEPLREERQLPHLIPYLGLGLTGSPDSEEQFQVFATGWLGLEGVMILTPETDFDADVRAGIAADNERALRDLLLAFPPGQLGFFYLAGEWMLPTLAELFDGRMMPSREGYYATQATFTPWSDYPARRLGRGDYGLVRTQWSESVWHEILEEGYAVHACIVDEELRALCLRWETATWHDQVNGLQFVREFARPDAECALSSATGEVIEQGKIALSTAHLSDDGNALQAFRNVGFRPFYRIPSFLGIKRGSGRFTEVSPGDFFRGRRRTPPPTTTGSTRRAEPGYPPRSAGYPQRSRSGEGGRISTSKDPLLARFRDLAHASGRREHGQFLVEGPALVQRAIHDGLPIESILYTADLSRTLDGVSLLHAARLAGVDHYHVTEGLMGRVTTTRPVPPVVAAVCVALRDAGRFRTGLGTSLLVVENVTNPDNLGMILRTADAAGVEGVVVLGERSDAFHKNCVRAARGAVGRVPILTCADPTAYLHTLCGHQFRIVGATLRGEMELYRCEMRPPVAVVVGNEQVGISAPVLEACTSRVRIPMAPGQDSLNVGVASGVLLYEVFRQRTAGKGTLA